MHNPREVHHPVYLFSECQRTRKSSKHKYLMIYGFLYMVGVCLISKCLINLQKACYARCFDLLHNSTLSSICIHFGVELLVFAAPLTSAVCQKTSFFDRLGNLLWQVAYLSRNAMHCSPWCGTRRMSSVIEHLRPSPTAATRSGRFIRHRRRSLRSLWSV